MPVSPSLTSDTAATDRASIEVDLDVDQSTTTDVSTTAEQATTEQSATTEPATTTEQPTTQATTASQPPTTAGPTTTQGRTDATVSAPPGYVGHVSSSGLVSIAVPDDWQLADRPSSHGEGVTLWAESSDQRATLTIAEESTTYHETALRAEFDQRFPDIAPSTVTGISGSAGEQYLGFTALRGTEGDVLLVTAFRTDRGTAWVTVAGDVDIGQLRIMSPSITRL